MKKIEVKKKYTLKEIEHIKAEAEKGNQFEMLRLGNIYHFGQGVEIDYELGFQYYQKAAMLENSDGLLFCALSILNDKVKIDKSKGIECLVLSAKLGNTNAMWRLGAALIEGEYVKQNYKLAYVYLTQSAKKNEKQAFYYLGIMYEEGYYVNQNEEVAFNYYTKSALQGDRNAQFQMGMIYDVGVLGVVSDVYKAIEWYKLAAKQQHIGALIRLYSLASEEIWRL